MKDYNFQIQVLTLPIWGSAWIIDRVFKLKIFINDIDEASNKLPINFRDYRKFILLNTVDHVRIFCIINGLVTDEVDENFAEEISKLKLKYAHFKRKLLLEINREIQFETFNLLVLVFQNSLKVGEQLLIPMGILLNKNDIKMSYLIVKDEAFPFKLIGKTAMGKRLYVNLDKNEFIYYNNNIPLYQRFNFQDFQMMVNNLSFNPLVQEQK